MSTLESIKAAMTATNALFGAEVIAKRNYDAFDQIYTSNSRILPPGAPIVTGRDEIKKFWKGFIESANVVAGSLEYNVFLLLMISSHICITVRKN